MTKADFKKVAASRIVSWKFSVISEDSYTLALPVNKLFSCVLRTIQLIIFAYIATSKIFRITYLTYLSHRKLCCLLLFLENIKILENVWQNRCSMVFVAGLSENFLLRWLVGLRLIQHEQQKKNNFLSLF